MPSTAEILDFTVSLSTLPALNDFLLNYDFVMIIKRDPNTTKKLPNIPKNHEDETVYGILLKDS